jgi:hypothetical protein
MSKPKGARQVTIGDDVYHWMMAGGKERDGQFLCGVMIWHAQSARPRSTLRVWFSCDRWQVIDRWFDFSTGRKRADPVQLRPITPGLIRKIIDAALAAGWQRSAAAPVQCEWTDDERLIPA